ncbi:hypothetical protein CERSUDRAFT_111810 [Gelatoporia subvermispora B]|uniref:F-box domain-containing protein n=1 Tax=Ceriporiopsis subvermispora (strain B) TaxID=914234 RepID=M2PS83_CERS8|nr:hypothetical protein CERSUDRAFT_111810 [Gelatoporia subvermispora B]
MELPQEAYNLIVKYVGSKTDLAALCTVSRAFQRAAERALYNTLDLRGQRQAVSVCDVLARMTRLAVLVVALSIFAQDGESSGEDSTPPNDVFWSTITHALQNTTRLRFLNIYAHHGIEMATAWILDSCSFQLRNFHCDLAWDDHLISFLSTQSRLTDLYLVDYKDSAPSLAGDHDHILPRLSVLECTFTEAATALVPGRPITRLKTCFSRTSIDGKRSELRALLSSIRLSRKALRALDIADSSYTAEFSSELLTSLVNSVHVYDLRYLGTLVLPIGGRQRLEFYGLLIRFSKLRCVEVDVSEWDPPPTHPAALRALACELRLYCPTVSRVIFVYDFERLSVSVLDNLCVPDDEEVSDNLWRDV